MKSLKNHEPKVHDMDVKILSMFNEKKIDSPGKCIYIVCIMILSLLLLQYNIVIYYINCLTRKYTFWIKAQFVDNLSNCKSLKKNEKMIERKKVKMLLCTTPWSPAPPSKLFLHQMCSLRHPLPLLLTTTPTFNVCKIPRFHILWPCKFSWDAAERPCNACSHKLCWSKALLVLKWNFSIQYLEYSEILMLERTSTNCNISY